MIAKKGDPILSIDGKHIVAKFARDLDMQSGNNAFSWVGQVRMPRMPLDVDEHMRPVRYNTLALRYDCVPIRIWQMTSIQESDKDLAFRGNSLFTHPDGEFAPDAVKIRAAIDLILANMYFPSNLKWQLQQYREHLTEALK